MADSTVTEPLDDTVPSPELMLTAPLLDAAAVVEPALRTRSPPALDVEVPPTRLIDPDLPLAAFPVRAEMWPLAPNVAVPVERRRSPVVGPPPELPVWTVTPPDANVRAFPDAKNKRPDTNPESTALIVVVAPAMTDTSPPSPEPASPADIRMSPELAKVLVPVLITTGPLTSFCVFPVETDTLPLTRSASWVAMEMYPEVAPVAVASPLRMRMFPLVAELSTRPELSWMSPPSPTAETPPVNDREPDPVGTPTPVPKEFPVESSMKPDFPSDDVPVSSLTWPETPRSPALADRTDTDPDVDDSPNPDAKSMKPPVCPLPLPARSRISPPNPSLRPWPP